MIKEYLLNSNEVLKHYETSENGLNSDEVIKRQGIYGKNKLKEEKKEGILTKFLKELANPMTIVLLAAAFVSAVTAVYAGESMVDSFIILLVVMINAILGVIQETKAEAAIASLQKMSTSMSKVIRNGNQMIVESEELVPGDIILLEAGDSAPADARIIECASLKVEEAALTGESVSIEKTTKALTSENDEITLGDRKNMLYMGSTVTYGRGKAVVCGTGMNTELGKIATALTAAKKEETPLQIKLNQLSKILSALVLGICVVIFAFNIIRSFITTGSITTDIFIDTFMIAVSLAVASVPEGLSTVVTILLSIAVTKMSKCNAVIRKLTAVETLGCTQIICSDKTGTLTQNKMTVVDHYTDSLDSLIVGMALCSDAEVNEDNTEAVGEATECALVNDALKNKYNKKELKLEYPRIAEAPFDSNRKMMSTIHEFENKFIQFTKGAPDEVLKCCSYVLKDGKLLKLTEEYKNIILNENKQMADKALRVLCLATKEMESIPEDVTPNSIERDLIFVGLSAMKDPIREEVKVAVDECKKAGVRAIMITGDHKDTAVAIAKELGILNKDQKALTGLELDKISDKEFEMTIRNYSVYARVQPEHKIRIVETWKKLGNVVAMTGDGVNDAPAIKGADIGVAMGITGTDVTKSVADMVLADDNFATIVSAVAEGRRIYDNMIKTIEFLLSSNLAEVFTVFVASVLGFTVLKPIHLLWINLITDTFPAIGIGVEPEDTDLMERKPRDKRDGVFANGVGFETMLYGACISILTLAAYFVGHYVESGKFEIANSPNGSTMAFLTLSLLEVFQAYNMRSRIKSIFKLKKRNTVLLATLLFSLVITTLVVYIPFLRTAFSFEPISLYEYGIAVIIAIMIVPIAEIVKFIKRKIKN